MQIMRRREVILLIAGTTLASSTIVRAQQAGRLRRIGVVMLYPEKDQQGQLRSAAFQQQLEKLGWTIGGNLQIDFKWGTGDADWVRSATEDVLSRQPDVLLANGDPAIKAAQGATRTVPVIFIGSGDPVGDGLIQSLAHPGGNLTGFAVMEPSLGAKLLGILKQVAPHVTRVAALVNPDNSNHKRITGQLTDAAAAFGVEIVSAAGRETAEIETAMGQWGQGSGLWCHRAVRPRDQFPSRTCRRVGSALPAADHLLTAKRRRRWRPNVLWRRCRRTVSPSCDLC
jgi:putative ABC transport system substrate-binding protein